ncbi:hypothetical protein PPACK8108_LOCUS24932 [Phakopsora pachyrhizi]|uniref:Uncharacterized protein n=1 Tax=Phakopsora pachyrhizi TaxID=170000 RepID=A0AAV0BRR1_PHAPC|nr:hypothetical protein PPACK8108_LOCUS24932 [Phakopsora pachyrhizi]
MYEMIEGRNIDEDIRNTQAGKSAGVAGWKSKCLDQYGGYGNPYYGGYYYPYDKQTPYYGYGKPDYVTGHTEGSGLSFHNIEDFQPPHGYPRIYPKHQSKERHSQDFGQSPHSGIQSLKGKERQYQDFEESFDGDKIRDKQTQLQDYEEIETDEDKILNPEIPATSPRPLRLRYEGLLKQHPLRDFDTVGELKQKIGLGQNHKSAHSHIACHIA